MPKFRTLFLAGERADPDTVKGPRTSQGAGHRPLVADRDRLGDRAIRSASAGCRSHGSPTVAMPGYDVRIVDEGAHEGA
jgi:propionyl-CoA synthetase